MDHAPEGRQTQRLIDARFKARPARPISGLMPIRTTPAMGTPRAVSDPPTRRARHVRAVLRAACAIAALAGVVAPAAQGTSSTVITRFAGTGVNGVEVPGLATNSKLDYPTQVAVNASGNVYFADETDSKVYLVTQAGVLSLVAGTGVAGPPSAGPATTSDLSGPQDVAVDSSGDLYIADGGNQRVEKVTPDGMLSVIAGSGTQGTSTNGPAIDSDLDNPYGVAVNSAGDVYITNNGDGQLDEVTPDGTLTVLAGTGTNGAITPGPATSSELNFPYGVAVDSGGNAYVADSGNNEVDEVTAGGTISAFAGIPGSSGLPTAGPAASSLLTFPQGIAVDASGNVYVADTYNYDVEKITPGGTLSILAGTGGSAAPTYNGTPTGSAIREANGVAIDSTGVIYLADTANYTIDRIGPRTPSAPTLVSAAAGQGSIALTIKPPVSVGTSQVTAYEASTDGGTTWQGLSTSSGTGNTVQATLGGLIPSASYTVEVRADNTSGSSSASGAQSVTLPAAPVATTGTTGTTTGTAGDPPAAPRPNSTFSSVHAPYINTTSGTLVLYVRVNQPGRLRWHAVFHDEPLTPLPATMPCAAFAVMLGGNCPAEWHTYGRGLRTVSKAGLVEIDVAPSPRAMAVLHRAINRHRAGFPVTIVVAFRSAYGGAAVTHLVTALATMHPPR